MPHSYTSCLMHCIFSTKERRPLIRPEIGDRLWAYMGGIAKENDIRPLTVGDVADHSHMLLALPSIVPVAKAIQLIKGGASKWIHETFPQCRDFEWQEGYGAFSIGVSQADATVAYIKGQEAHHRRRSFQDEFRAILRRHGIEIDEQHIWG